MYSITLNDEPFYYPGDAKYTLTECVLHESLNDAGYMEITIPPTNPAYNLLDLIVSKLTLRKDDQEIFIGEVREIEVDFFGEKHLYVAGILSWLNDTYVSATIDYGASNSALLSTLLAYHNERIKQGGFEDASHRFYAGTIADSGRNDIAIEYGYILDTIREKLCKDDKYIRLRRQHGLNYIDILTIENYGKTSEQYIRFGENLLDYAEKYDADALCTAVVPLGARDDEYSTERLEKFITIKDVNKDSEVIFSSPEVLAKYGYKYKVVHYDEITDPQELYSRGLAYLRTWQYSYLTLDLTAVDLSMLDTSKDDFNVGDYVNCIAEPFGMAVSLPVRSKETNILDLTQNKITLGNRTKARSLTNQMIDNINELDDSIESPSRVLLSAKEQAKKLMNSNAKNGQVSIRTTDDGIPYEIIIMNNKDIKYATKGWRWNMGGFGFGTKKYGDNEFSWEPSVAITMDGAIVADKITTGTMKADRIKGGSLIMGGTDISRNGEIIVNDKNGNQKAKLSPSGVAIDGQLYSESKMKNGKYRYTRIKNGAVQGGYDGSDTGRVTFDNKVNGNSSVMFQGYNNMVLSAPKLWVGTSGDSGDEYDFNVWRGFSGEIEFETEYEHVVLAFKNGLCI